MPKQEDNINTSKEIQDKGDRKTHKWSVWSQGPDNAKETTRKFKQTTPGQVRDYKHFVNKRRFQKFEQVESVQPKNEDAPANSVAGGGVDMAPNAKGTKVFMKKFRVDGRTKEYREANRRIKERQERIAQRQVQSKLDMFGVHANPFAEETESKKYLDTKEGSIEDAIIKALTNLDNPNDERETLTLPKKDVEVEEGFGKLKDASKNLSKMHKAMGIKKDKTTTKKTAKGGIVQTSTYKKANEEKKSGYLEPDMKKRQANNEKARKDMKKMGTPMKNPHLEQTEIDELSNKTMSSYAQKASASQSDAEKKQDYKTADKRMAGKMRASRRKFSNDTNKILVGLKKESKETENGERDAGSDKYTNYTKEMTPGQGITNPDAKKADVRKKKEQAAQQQQLNVDEDMKYLNTKEGSIEEAITKALRPEAFTTKHEKGDKHTEVPEKKAGETDKDHKDRQAGRVSFKQHRRSLDRVDPDELKGKHADRDDKDIDNDGDSDSSDRYLHRRRQAIASRRKKEDAKEEVEEARGAPTPKNIQGPARRYSSPLDSPKAKAAREKLQKVMRGIKKKDPDHPAVQNVKEEDQKVRGSKQAHESVELTPTEQFEQLVAEKHKASKGRLRSPEGKPSDMKWKYKFSPAGRETPSPRTKADSRERARSGQTIGSIGSNATGTTGTGPRKNQGTSGKSGANTDRPDWYQSSQKGSEHKTSRGVKTKGVKQTSNKIKPGVKPKGKLPEQAIEVDETHAPGHKPRQLKDPKKEKMVGTKTGTKVVNRNDPKYKNAPEHESVESPWIRAAVAHLDKVAEKTIDGVKVKQLKPGKETKDVQNALKDKDSIVRQQARQKVGYAKRNQAEEIEVDENIGRSVKEPVDISGFKGTVTKVPAVKHKPHSRRTKSVERYGKDSPSYKGLTKARGRSYDKNK